MVDIFWVVVGGGEYNLDDMVVVMDSGGSWLVMVGGGIV